MLKYRPVFFLLFMVLVIVGTSLTAHATEFPPGLIRFIHKLDPEAKVRFDGLITFKNGEVYVPVFPQAPEESIDPIRPIAKYPKDEKYPDYIQFNNNLFLIRIVKTPSGKLTFRKLTPYPIELKAGLLPQDLVMPDSLYLPTELKVILGDLPYQPKTSAELIEDSSTEIASLTALSTPSFEKAVKQWKPTKQTLFLTSLSDQSVVVVDPLTGKKTENIQFNCVPSSITSSPNGDLLFIGCLTSDELVVVDTRTSLVKTRIPVGKKPSDVLYVKDLNQIIVSNRFSNYLSIIGIDDLLSKLKADLHENKKDQEEARGGVMVYNRRDKTVLVADTTAGLIYEIDTLNHKTKRKFSSLRGISALWIQEDVDDTDYLWMTSRAEHQVRVVDLKNGKIIKSFEVGNKPVGMAAYKDNLFIVSANGDRIDVIDTAQNILKKPIVLDSGSFPSAITLSPDGQHAYVTATGAKSVYLVDLTLQSVEKKLPVDFRSIALTVVGEKPKASTRGNQ